jgi:hypothetical protein
LIYASSSSVYGANQHTPYSVQDGVNHPLSLYAATKKANELMAHSYSHLFGIPCTGLRFFTVYGPWGRPDMSPIQFARAIAEGTPLKLFNYGEHQRDFTYIDDIIESIARLIDRAPQANPNGTVNNRIRPAAWRHGGSSTSAASTRWSSRPTWRCWKNTWGKKPWSSCCPCNPAMCSTPAPMPAIWPAPPVSSPVSSWMKDSGGSSPGSATTTHCLSPTRRSRLNYSGGLPNDWT